MAVAVQNTDCRVNEHCYETVFVDGFYMAFVKLRTRNDDICDKRTSSRTVRGPIFGNVHSTLFHPLFCCFQVK